MGPEEGNRTRTTPQYASPTDSPMPSLRGARVTTDTRTNAPVMECLAAVLCGTNIMGNDEGNGTNYITDPPSPGASPMTSCKQDRG
jgi:hypothetical protein